MSLKTEIEGIVIYRVPYGNNAEMLTVLTNNGQCSFAAHGLNKIDAKNASSTLILSHSFFTLSIRNQHLTLSESKLIKSYRHLYEDIVKMSAAQAVNEIIFRFIDNEDGRIYPYLKSFLLTLENGYDPLTLVCIMLAQVIRFSGYALEYNECVLCGEKTRIVAVDYQEGGYVCYRCTHKIKMNEEYLKSYRYSFMVPSESLDHYQLSRDVALRLINEYHRYLCEKFECKELKGIMIFLDVC